MTDTASAHRLFLALDALQQQGNSLQARNMQFPNEAARLEDLEQRLRRSRTGAFSEQQIQDMLRLARWPYTLVHTPPPSGWPQRLSRWYVLYPTIMAAVLVFVGGIARSPGSVAAMITGRQLLCLLDRNHHQADKLLAIHQSSLSASLVARDRCLEALRQAYDVLAITRLDEAAIPHQALEEVDGWIVNEAHRRSEDYRALLGRLLQATHLADKLEQVLANQAFALGQAQSDYDRARQRATSHLLRYNSTFSSLTEHRTACARRIEDVETRLGQSSAHMTQFLTQCRQDPVFSYCEDRQVGQPTATGNSLARWVDRQAARACNYTHHMAILAQARADHAEWVGNLDILRQELGRSMQVMEKMLDDYLASSPDMVVGPVRDGLVGAMRKTLHEKDVADYQVRSLTGAKRAFDKQEDPSSQEMKKRLSLAMETASSHLLSQAALETKSLADDRAAAILGDLRNQLPALDAAVSADALRVEKATGARDRLGALRLAIVGRGLAGEDAGFDDEATLTGLVMGMEEGIVSPAHVLSCFVVGSRPLTVGQPPLSSRGLPGGF